MESGRGGVLFDWDGTLLDSKSSITTAWHIVLEDLGVEVPNDVVDSLFALGWPAAYDRAVEHGSLPEPATMLVHLARTRSRLARPQLFEDALPTIRRLRTSGMLLAVVTNTNAPRLFQEMSEVGLDIGIFAAIATADAVDAPKPAPHVYSHALELLGAPSAVVAIEDTLIGMTAARAAGVRTVLVDRSERAVYDPPNTVRGLDADEIIGFLGKHFTT